MLQFVFLKTQLQHQVHAFSVPLPVQVVAHVRHHGIQEESQLDQVQLPLQEQIQS
jgi:anti-sigma factor RsiW